MDSWDATARIESEAPAGGSVGEAGGGSEAGRLPEGLTRRDAEILAFERQWWKYAGAKEQAVRELFDLSPTRYYQLLNALIDTPAALAHDPMLVKRLRRMRSSRQRARSARRLGVQP
ncbi:DUF3263 domain-containing protein [Kineococcus sp. TBRC 1896]|uniref:DUF3263 domain-containing protein n=1 Tax=Kineococcus mangrovi TaxID=1660183 RepID=A0ABV4HZI3_9ACTN